jgi:hypothetical protein
MFYDGLAVKGTLLVVRKVYNLSVITLHGLNLIVLRLLLFSK